MFLFILGVTQEYWELMGFKYISCSYLSVLQTALKSFHQIQIHLMFLFIQALCGNPALYCYSNTSHVLIYLFLTAFSIALLSIQIHLMFLFICTFASPYTFATSFKYISCSYLSNKSDSAIARNVKFKYISCSYLSSASHSSLFIVNNSNTSHVLIYRERLITIGSNVFIQIHLMFLFIQCLPLLLIYRKQFKYISCSYLSMQEEDWENVKIKFKYISCSYLSCTFQQHHQ